MGGQAADQSHLAPGLGGLGGAGRARIAFCLYRHVAALLDGDRSQSEPSVACAGSLSHHLAFESGAGPGCGGRERDACARRAGRRRSISKTCAGNCCGATAGCEEGPEVNWADCSAPSWKPRARSRTSLNTSGPINRSSTPATSWTSGLGAPCAAALSR